MSADIHAQKILILDFGSQYTQLIARRVREIGVYCEIHPFDMDEDALRVFHPHGVILSGGPETVTGGEAPRAPKLVFELGVPVLGICYGMQAAAVEFARNVREVRRDALDLWRSLLDRVDLLDHGVGRRPGW